MVIKRSKKPELPKKEIKKSDKKKKELSFLEEIRLEEAKEKEEKKKADEVAKKEEEHKHKIIRKYLVKYNEKLLESTGRGFYVWCDLSSFKRTNGGIKTIQKEISKDIDKYIGRKIAYITIDPRHKEYGIKELFINPNAWIRAGVWIYKIDKRGKLDQKSQTASIDWEWHTDDFKISKPLFKVFEWIMHIAADHNIYAGGIQGTSLEFLLEWLKKRKNIKPPKDLFQPLANV